MRLPSRAGTTPPSSVFPSRSPLRPPGATPSNCPTCTSRSLLDTQRRLASVTAVNIDGEALLDLPRTGRLGARPARPGERAGRSCPVQRQRLRPRSPRASARSRVGGCRDGARRDRADLRLHQRRPAGRPVQPGRGPVGRARGPRARRTPTRRTCASRCSPHPVLADGDPPYRGVQIPRRFWKVAAWTSDGALRAAGFVLDQSDLLDDGSPRPFPRSADSARSRHRSTRSASSPTSTSVRSSPRMCSSRSRRSPTNRGASCAAPTTSSCDLSAATPLPRSGRRGSGSAERPVRPERFGGRQGVAFQPGTLHVRVR